MKNKVLDYNYASNAIKGYSNSSIAKKEKNDCFVRAIAAATGSKYDSAHEFVKETFDRKEGKGTEFTNLVMTELENKGFTLDGKEFKVKVLPKSRVTNSYKLYGDIVHRQKTVKSFMKDNPQGTFIVGVSKHAFTVKDGLLIDNAGEEFRPTRKVQSVFQIFGDSNTNQLSLF
mgnify:CR=1 FL=1|tara:strand:- start:241 stop:759 length:519 start_codon:yes stop_codon:yes gene_type:complete